MTHHVLTDPGPLGDDPTPPPFHNRWHPDVPPVLRIEPGDTVELDTRDALDGQIRPGTTAADLPGLRRGRVHPLTGPVHVDGAEPGDLLAVHVERIRTAARGFTATFPGRALLPEAFPGPILVHWDLDDGHATSEQIPGVRVAGAPFPGTIGLAPSRERLHAVNDRERRAAGRWPLVALPSTEDARPADPVIAAQAWRTTPAREVGGNMDVRQLVAGSTVYLPVDVPGALFSVGDGHFAQGDGETCGTAVETSTRMTLRFELLPGDARPGPEFSVPSADRYPGSRWFGTTGLSVHPDGEVSYLDASLAARNAVVAMVDALVRDRGLTPEQAYVVVSVAGDLRISSIVNVPHAQVSVFVPEDVFVRR